ncbi:NAD(P)-binding protein [Teratosphaeria nubilosa]|uniref:NAD(P)-binding protein n=1 Tax=Teratosphaeria nubilosa TaxID=161662 RepID=A0A6G1L638_9PEZI|nr:NAD(P)-binding protein [Teratosphaeria nubilosa]
MCAGASTYEALDVASVTPNDHVGVVGIGGLGHMAVLFASAMGCAVSAISSSHEKRNDAFRLGADEYRSLTDIPAVYRKEAVDKRIEDAKPMSINILLLTSNEVPDLEPILPLLARRATIVLMTIQAAAITIPYMPFVLPGHKLIASTEASRENHIKMLDFAARHRIKPWVEEFPMDEKGVEAAFEKLESGRMRYRGILVRQE